MQAAQRLDRRPDHVDRVGGAERLGQDVADAGRLDDGANRAAGDDAGALRGGLEQHAARAESPMRTSWGIVVPDHRHPDEVLLRVLDALADRLGDLAGLAQPDAHVAVAVADDDDGAEAEAAAALDDLGDAVDLDDTLLERRGRASIRGKGRLLRQNSSRLRERHRPAPSTRPW